MTAPNSGVAVVGMAGRFPGARDVAEFWDNLQCGRETISFFTADELVGVDPALLADPAYVKARGVLADADKFDAAFFGVSPREAEVMDPQQRVFLETAWAALEDAGCDPASEDRMIGVYAGMANNTYFLNCVQSRPDLVRSYGEFNVMLANEKDFLATRVSHKLNLRGPSISLYTGCSTSLVAISQAYHALMSYQCDVALAGGVAISVPQKAGYLPVAGGIQSSDGHCRPFDRQASGTVFSDGVGVVVLKRVEDALADGDRLDAVILSAALNNDGADKMSFAAPSVEGQAGAVSLALSQAGIGAEAISYVEAHGTGTALGDPIEIEALTRAFRATTDRRNFCAVGSVKSNLGHLLAAAGVAGFIKTVLALRHGQLPPSLHFEAPNPEIQFSGTPFFVQSRLADWPRAAGPRRAGVSSFGIGGTNAHVILEEAPVQSPSLPSPSHELLLLSARTPDALERQSRNLADWLERPAAPAVANNSLLADAAYTLRCGRSTFAHRRALVCSTVREAIDCLRDEEHRRRSSAGPVEAGARAGIAFLFPGQGSQYSAMGRRLYDESPDFRRGLDQCLALHTALAGWSLKDRMFAANTSPDALADAETWQPAIFAVSYALAEALAQWEIVPDVMLGHSVGGLVAATRAGVFSLEDAFRLVVEQGRWLKECPPGGMLAVMLPAEKLSGRLPAQLALAAANSGTLSVVAGPWPALAALETQLHDENIACRRLASSHAFHSPLMAPLLSPLEGLLRSFNLRAPTSPVISATTGLQLTDAEAMDPRFWAHQITQTVRFTEGLDCLAGLSCRLVLEVGPGVQAATFARQRFRDERKTHITSLLGEHGEREWPQLLEGLACVWLHSERINWAAFAAQTRRRKIALPTYPFARISYWAGMPARPAPWTETAGPTYPASVIGGGRAIGPEAVPVPARSVSGADDLRQRVDARLRHRQARNTPSEHLSSQSPPRTHDV